MSSVPTSTEAAVRPNPADAAATSSGTPATDTFTSGANAATQPKSRSQAVTPTAGTPTGAATPRALPLLVKLQIYASECILTGPYFGLSVALLLTSILVVPPTLFLTVPFAVACAVFFARSLFTAMQQIAQWEAQTDTPPATPQAVETGAADPT